MTLSNEVECDEADVVAGHKGQPEVVRSKGRKGRRRRYKSKFTRPGLTALLDYLRPGDTLAVVRVDCLGRSLGATHSTLT